ncbi:hypothetical protein TNCV_4763791 [Trichonephila clavipes]|nr:hypothetical protein TNCV_4763791 [Trichonephila clavipes]
MPPSEISDLGAKGFIIDECHNMTSRKMDEPVPLFLLSMEKPKDIKQFSKPSPTFAMTRSSLKFCGKNMDHPCASDVRVFSIPSSSARSQSGAQSAPKTTLPRTTLSQ